MDSFDGPIADASDETASPRRPLQFGLRGLLLLTSLVAVWGTVYLNRQSIAHLESRLSFLRRMAAELVVDDPSLITIVQRPPLWQDEYIWDVYLPRSDYRLHLATEMIDDDGTAPIDATIPLPQGTMKVELRQERRGDEGWRLSVLLDDREVVAIDKPAEWNAAGGSSSNVISALSEKQPDEPVSMLRRRFNIRSNAGTYKSAAEPAAGLLLWIEPAD